jgi:hypothetical protein
MTRPRPCAGCGVNPVAYYGRSHCYQCRPRVWKRPPQCKTCGSSSDYYTAGRCRRCHRSAAYIDSCPDCLAWGTTRHTTWLCQACRGWRARFPDPAQCISCDRTLPVNDRGLCRLCARQITLIRPAHESIDPREANRDGQQLFIADLFRQKRPVEPRHDHSAGWPAHYPVTHRQLVLFAGDRDLTAAAAGSVSPLPDLTGALDDAVHEHAASHGWNRWLLSKTLQSIRLLAALQDTPGALIKHSEAALLNQLPAGTVQPVLEVLESIGMLEDDREPPLQEWFIRRTEGLAEPMTTEVGLWFQILRDGSATPPRRRPRQTGTVRTHISAVLPALQAWTRAGHRSLREITPEDIRNLALPEDPGLRRLELSALRGLFATLKAHQVVFSNPTARLSTGPVTTKIPLPLDLDVLRQALHCADPARAALAALLAFHAPRPQHLRALHLTDVRDGRMILEDRTVLLAGPARARLAAWLDERARRWPHTINPHVFINQYTAVRTRPVSKVWVTDTLGISARAIRDDRILHEACATEGDVRRLCDLFGLSVPTALRYTHSPDHLADPDSVGSRT